MNEDVVERASIENYETANRARASSSGRRAGDRFCYGWETETSHYLAPVRIRKKSSQ